MKLVVDASVALKWFLAANPAEDHIDEAMAVGEAIQTRGCELFAPPHWAVEIISVLARNEPQLVDEALVLLAEVNPILIAEAHVLKHAAELSGSLNHHLFDTLYHAVALETGATLVTADKIYFNKASKLGGITRLSDFRP